MINVKNLNITYPGNYGHVVKNLSFNLSQEKLGIVGESGSGKSLLARSLLGIVPEPGVVQATCLEVLGLDLLTLSLKQFSQFRGTKIALITQDPKTSLNPVIKVGLQIAEGFIVHQKLTKKQAMAAALELLKEVQLANSEQVFNQYPHQLSGGMGQRVLVAVMLACNPKILIADEATSALDQQTKVEILTLLNKLHYTRKMAMIIISHDLPLIAQFCDRVLIMSKGEIIDSGNAKEISNSSHEFTKILWSCLPSAANRLQRLPEQTIAEDCTRNR